MPLWRVYKDGSKTPKKVKGGIHYESEIEKILMANPELLPHKRKVLWFSKTRNGPGDLVGLDKKGSLVVVEVKKTLGKREVNEARKQVKKRSQKVSRYTEEDIQREYAYLRWHWRSRTASKKSFREQFESYFGRKFKLRPEKVYKYIVGESSTWSGERRMKKLERRVKKNIIHVVMHLVNVDAPRATISVERLG